MKTTQMTGTYPTFDDYLTVTFDEENHENDWISHQNIRYFESEEEISCAWLVKKYGREDAERFIMGAIRNAKEI
jgi:hypothetical protein